ncbi:MAG: IS3 family transposase [Bacteroidales bacterium]|nr:IS3 family transposase [Bacteroidales bacterium]
MSNLHARDAARYAVASLCGLLGVSKQAYYQHDDDRALAKAAMREFALQYARLVRAKDPGMGIMKIWVMYQGKFRGERDILGRDLFADLLTEAGMKVRLKVRKPRTTDSAHGLPVYPDLAKELIPERPNQLWVSDITYMEIWPTDEECLFCYLSMIMDAYSKEIIGWSVGDTLSASYPIEALAMALKRTDGLREGTIHHSDRGVQYASRGYVGILREHGIAASMTETGDPKDNSQAERLNSTMKNELLKGRVFRSLEEARSAVAEAVDFYNNQRPHMSLDMMAPAKAAAMSGEMRKRWKSYREAAIRKKNKVVV